jgi:hypothetical protein
MLKRIQRKSITRDIVQSCALVLIGFRILSSNNVEFASLDMHLKLDMFYNVLDR